MKIKTRTILVVAMAAFVQPAPQVWCAPTSSSSKPVTKSGVKMDSHCEQILRKMTDTYKSCVSMSSKITIDMVLSKGAEQQKLPGTYLVSIAKPNRFSVELDSTRGGKAVSNGKRSEFYFKPENVYMIAPSLPTLVDGFDKHEFRYVTAGLINFAFARELMEVNPYAAVLAGIDRVQYVGNHRIGGVDCDHLKMFQAEISRDIWISKGATPVLVKVQPDMNATMTEKAKAAGNKILLTFTYSDQVFNKPMNDGRFETAHPNGAKFVREFFHEEGAELIGKKAPDVKLSMADGTSINLSSLRDRLVVLDFWATWCPPCVMSLPIFAKVSEKFKSKGIVFIAVNKGEDPNTAKNYLKTNHIRATLATDQNGKVASAFNVEGIPCSVFIGRDGIVKGVHVGINPNGLSESFSEDLEKLLNGKSLKREQ